ncbi:asparagine synthetase B [Lewinella sp. JB7]|uniref:asparagine synthetase B n=1 Tax=Lewinella sp. JB7 TaxID=2962887 RepID=UPI0020C9BFFF|nr:asparagine synthetase B [Lewinella sp. JB7]MCP9235864.1 asparagine synthetase B [Lewinella sp. JB7]
MFRKLPILVLLLTLSVVGRASTILIPMDDTQTDHLKAYGITYWVLNNNIEAWWLLNYRGGSFAFQHSRAFERECLTRGVKYEVIADARFNGILEEIADPERNMDAMKLEKAPKIAVYTPDYNFREGTEVQPWDDAVTLVLTYAEIPYETVYDNEVLEDKLAEYDWLHLHHEDFTGQFGRFYRSFQNAPWYRRQVAYQEELAAKNGYEKVSQLKLGVVKKVRDYVGGGGFMFAMCSATDSYDIALAANGTDICAEYYDGDGIDPNAQSKLDFSQTFAFENFQLERNPLEYEFSDIDHNPRQVTEEQDYFTLFDFSAKWDPVPTMLTQNHVRSIKGFMGQTTAFTNDHIKSDVLVLGENKPAREARYLHGQYGQGFFTFYGGHDPADYRHLVNDPETDLSLHPKSPGYRLILNNILFPAAKKKKRKT